MPSSRFSLLGPKKPHLVVGRHGVAGEVDQLRADVESSFYDIEERSNYPHIHSIDALQVSRGAGADVDLVLTGIGFGTVAGNVIAFMGAVTLTTVLAGHSDTNCTVRVESTDLAALPAANSLCALRLDVNGVEIQVTLNIVA
jgi:hypothetical protein